MDEIKHWWNSIKYLTKLNGETANSCRMHYVQCCRELSTSLELPKQNFGPSTMCSHCGSLWSKSVTQTRIIPGKPHSKSVKKIVGSCSENDKISRFKATLMKKSLKNKMNKVVIKCSVCSKNTEVKCNKPQRLKVYKEKNNEADVSIALKRKKKKVKDKTAGLNISNSMTPEAKDKKETIVNFTPVNVKIKKSKGKEITPLQKIRKLNLAKLNNVLNVNKDQKTKNSLNNFLKELY